MNLQVEVSMSDYYTEQLVKQKAKASSMIAKTALIVVTVLSFFLVLLFPMAMIIPVKIGRASCRERV
mgnify:CR=1 FL=1